MLLLPFLAILKHQIHVKNMFENKLLHKHSQLSALKIKLQGSQNKEILIFSQFAQK